MEERRGTRPSPSCGRERELVRGVMLALAAGLLAAGAGEAYGASFSTVPTDNIYVNSDEALKRLFVCDGDTITLNPTVASLADGVHNIEATCSGDGPDATNTVSVTVDTTPPRTNVDTIPLYVGVEFDKGSYSHPNIPCYTDTGSPVEPFARSAYTDSANNTIPGIVKSTPVGTYNYWFRCYDAAGNTHDLSRVRILVEPAIPSSNLASPESDAHISGTVQAGYVFLPTEYKEEHGLTCRPGGEGMPIDNSKLVFDPWLPSLKPATRNDVTIHCLDSQGRSNAGTSIKTTVIVDIHAPHFRGPNRFFNPDTSPSSSSGIISPVYISTTTVDTYESVANRLSCVDSYDGFGQFPVAADYTYEIAQRTFDYESLGDRITPHFVADRTPEEGPPIFDVLNATCTDAAGHQRSWFWILARDRAYHPVEGYDVMLEPVITINDFVTVHPAGLYEYQEGSVECADYLGVDFKPNALDSRFVSTRVNRVAIGGETASPVALMQNPGIYNVPHVCVDGANAFAHTYTRAFVPHPDGPTITIDDSVTSAAAGEPVPVTATCTAQGGAELPVTTEYHSVHRSTKYLEGFSINPEDTTIDREYHAVFSCRDSDNRVALASAKFTQTAVGPRVTLDGYESLGIDTETGDDRETRASAIRNAHIHGTAYADPGATCVNAATGEEVDSVVASGAPDENTAVGKWSTITYTCTIGDQTDEVVRKVRTIVSRVVTDTPGRTSHDGSNVFVDDAVCTSSLGRPIVPEVVKITGPDGGTVPVIDHLTPEGTYTIDYKCTDSNVLKGERGPKHLRPSFLFHYFSKQVSVPAPSTAPFITLEGDGERPVIPGQVYEMTVFPREKYVEPGFSCTDRPGLEDVADVEANFTAGDEIPDEGVTIEYTCTAPDGDTAEPQYRRLVPEAGLDGREKEGK